MLILIETYSTCDFPGGGGGGGSDPLPPFSLDPPLVIIDVRVSVM